MNDRRRVGEDDGNGIEANLIPFDAGTVHVSAGGSDDVLLLLLIYGAIRAAKFKAAARLDLNEDNQVSLPRDHVDLRIAARLVVAGDNLQALLLKIAMGDIFAAAAQRGRLRHRLALPQLPGCVAQLPEELGGLDGPAECCPAVAACTASSCHSMTLPRMR